MPYTLNGAQNVAVIINAYAKAYPQPSTFSSSLLLSSLELSDTQVYEPQPSTLHPTRYTRLPTPYTMHPTPYNIHPTHWHPPPHSKS